MNSSNTNTELPDVAADTASGTFSGRILVVIMFLGGLTATTVLWTYWHMHLIPFMPLQQALADEFEESSPRVDGGQRKIHKRTPPILRIVMRVPFDPTGDGADAQSQVEHRIARTHELSANKINLNQYEYLEIHLYNEPKEKQLLQRTFLKELATGEVQIVPPK